MEGRSPIKHWNGRGKAHHQTDTAHPSRTRSCTTAGVSWWRDDKPPPTNSLAREAATQPWRSGTPSYPQVMLSTPFLSAAVPSSGYGALSLYPRQDIPSPHSTCSYLFHFTLSRFLSLLYLSLFLFLLLLFFIHFGLLLLLLLLLLLFLLSRPASPSAAAPLR